MARLLNFDRLKIKLKERNGDILRYLNRKSNYDKYPVTNIIGYDDGIEGYEAIAKKILEHLGDKKIIVVDCYPGVNDEEVLTALIKGLKPDRVIKSADMFSKPIIIDGLELYIAKIEGTTPDSLRSMGDELKNKGDNVVALIAGVNGEKANLVAVCGKEAIAKGVKAGDLVREIAKMAGGGGGGRPDSAMAGAKDISKLDSAISAVEDTVKSLIK